MRKLCLLVGLFLAVSVTVWAQEEYPLGPDSQRQAGVPQGKVTQYSWTSKIFPSTVRDYWVYVPAQYTPDKPACVMFFEDGKGAVSESGRWRIPIVFDNLIAKHDMPVTIAILIDPGVLKGDAPGQTDRANRSFEYDALSDRYARFLLEEMLPEVGKQYKLSTDPNDRAIGGLSSGGICSFTVAWTHPEAFHRVLSFIGSFTDLRGGDIYPALIRKTEPKPLRVFLQDGDHDLNNFAGAWWFANQSMFSALTFAGYDVKFVTGNKDHDMIQGGAILPDALRWLWRDYPQPIARAPLHHLGDPQSGLVDVAPEWELVGPASGAPSSGKRPDSDTTAVQGFAAGPGGLRYGCDPRGIVSYSPEGKKTLLLRGVVCNDIVAAQNGAVYFTEAGSGALDYLRAGKSGLGNRFPAAPGESGFKAKGICLSPDQSLLYVSDPTSKWVWSYRVLSKSLITDGEPFFRLETLDTSSESGAYGLATDGSGLLYVATELGIQICDQQGRVVAILSEPERAKGVISRIAFGGPDHQYLYALAANEIYRRHFVKRPSQP
jgi:enterochelin esterase-like enzyme